MLAYVKKSINITIGIILLIVAAFLGPVPLFPGFIVAIPALYLLGKEIPWVERKYQAFKDKIKVKTGTDPEDYCKSYVRAKMTYFKNLMSGKSNTSRSSDDTQ